MELYKSFKLGNTDVEVYCDENKTEQEMREVLINMYDTINNLADRVSKRGIDTSDWFYTDEEIKKMKKDSRYKFI